MGVTNTVLRKPIAGNLRVQFNKIVHAAKSSGLAQTSFVKEEIYTKIRILNSSVIGYGKISNSCRSNMILMTGGNGSGVRY